MAVDTETKRRSALGMTIMSLVIAPLADGTIEAADRAHILGIYGKSAVGILTEKINIFSESLIEPEYASDEYGSLLIEKDLEVQGAFYPRILTQSAEPAPGTGADECNANELLVWKDSDDSKLYVCYNDAGTVKTVELI